MRKNILILGLVFFLTVGAYAYDDGDFQVWNIENQEFNLTKKSKLALEEEFRWGDNAHDFYYHHYDIGFIYDLNKYLNIGAGYRQVYEKKSGKFKEENEPYIMATLFAELAGWKFDSRNRLEYRHFDYQGDLWRYRNKLAARFPWKFTKLEIQPFLADEIFFNLNGLDLNQNRFFSGLGFSLFKNIKGEIYYMLQSIKSSGACIWSDANVLGTKLKVSF
ncbi:MAG: DUF2490 domain-containing protein [Candidatus Omnitrophica bacterium]|nr:DUF2490 domain-containing protein [Candidatus Omnitrophota bacterium]